LKLSRSRRRSGGSRRNARRTIDRPPASWKTYNQATRSPVNRFARMAPGSRPRRRWPCRPQPQPRPPQARAAMRRRHAPRGGGRRTATAFVAIARPALPTPSHRSATVADAGHAAAAPPPRQRAPRALRARARCVGVPIHVARAPGVTTSSARRAGPQSGPSRKPNADTRCVYYAAMFPRLRLATEAARAVDVARGVDAFPPCG